MGVEFELGEQKLAQCGRLWPADILLALRGRASAEVVLLASDQMMRSW
jgi:hypothetical protein